MSVNSDAPALRNEDSPRGFAFALTAYLFWGVLPLYMKALAHIPSAEVIAHRIVWSVPVAGLVLYATGHTGDLSRCFRSPRILAQASMTAVLITINWGTYVWAIANGRSLDAALGYFINPLFSIALGSLLLKEKMAPLQVLAIALAALAVIILTVENGSLPWVALLLAFSWGFYAFFRKTLPVGPNQGFFLEVLLLCAPALAYIAYLTMQGEGHFTDTGSNMALLIGCGLVTALPLIIYANGAKLLRLSTIGIMQYIVPTMVFLLAIFVFHEPMGTARMIAFPLIWAGLVLYTIAMLRAARRAGATSSR